MRSGPDIWCTILSPGASARETVLSPLIPIDTDFDALFDSILDNSDIEAQPQQQNNPNVPSGLDTFGGLLIPDQDQFPSQDLSAGDGFSFDCILDNSDIEAPPQQQTNSNAPSHLSTFGASMVSEQDQFPSQDLLAEDVLGFDSILDNSDIEAPPQQQTNSNAPSHLSTFGASMVSEQDQFLTQDLSAGNEPRRCCLTIALGFLTQLFPNAPTACTLPGSQAGTCKLPTIESVISKNKQITEAISNMLDCPCLQDEYVVAIISLIVFKVMAWYAAAAGDKALTDDGMGWSNHFAAYSERQQNPSSFGEQVVHLPTIIGNYCVDGNDQSRMAAQLVLSELHRVQRLVNLLSKRLEDIRLRNGGLSGSSSGSSSVADSGDVQVVRMGTSPLSGPTFYQLEADLRKRLRAVSSETIDILRRE
jgi:Aflatoxin regulatory protein